MRDHECTIRVTSSKDRWLGVEGGIVKVMTLQSESLADLWIIREVKHNQLLNNSCFIRATDTLQLIDVPGASQEEEEPLIIYDPNYRFNQRWNVYRSGEIFIIKSFFNKMNMDVPGARF